MRNLLIIAFLLVPLITELLDYARSPALESRRFVLREVVEILLRAQGRWDAILERYRDPS